LVVAFGFTLRTTFLTRGTTLDGSVGGYTGWDNPLDPDQNPSAAAFDTYARRVAIILYAGQCAERVLAEKDETICVPGHDPNWGNDDAEVAKLLVKEPLSLNPDSEEELRTEALQDVRRFWHVIERVALMLLPDEPAVLSSAPHAPASTVLRGPDVKQFLLPLDHEIHVGLEEDHVVLRHEIGHFVTWFLYGGGIGPLRLRRQPDGRLLAAVKVGPRSADERETPAFIDAVAERLLAGEIAARQHLEMCDWQVSIGDPRVVLFDAATQIGRVRTVCHRDLADTTNLLSLAEQHHPDDWWQWIENRLLHVRALLGSRAQLIEVLAKRLGPLVPSAGERRAPGTDLIRWGYDAGLAPLDEALPPVELIPTDCVGGPCVGVRRWWRGWGRHATAQRRG
jgi:hypothetical protein